MSTTDRRKRPMRAVLRLPRPRAGAAATGLFLTALALAAATMPLSEPADATTAHGTAQAALTSPAR